MIFVLIFMVAMLIVPLTIDIEKHGTDNIVSRSAREVLQLPFVKAPLRSAGVAVETVNALFAGVMTFTVLGLGAYALLRLFGTVMRMLIGDSGG